MKLRINEDITTDNISDRIKKAIVDGRLLFVDENYTSPNDILLEEDLKQDYQDYVNSINSEYDDVMTFDEWYNDATGKNGTISRIYNRVYNDGNHIATVLSYDTDNVIRELNDVIDRNNISDIADRLTYFENNGYDIEKYTSYGQSYYYIY